MFPRAGIMPQAGWTLQCPDENTLLDFVSAELSVELRGSIEAHVAECEDCTTVVGEVSKMLDPGLEHALEEVSSEAPGRYQLLREIGSGGQGRVFAAQDHHLVLPRQRDERFNHSVRERIRASQERRQPQLFRTSTTPSDE